MHHHKIHYRAKRHIYKRSAEKQEHEEDNFEALSGKVMAYARESELSGVQDRTANES